MRLSPLHALHLPLHGSPIEHLTHGAVHSCLPLPSPYAPVRCGSQRPEYLATSGSARTAFALLHLRLTYLPLHCYCTPPLHLRTRTSRAATTCRAANVPLPRSAYLRRAPAWTEQARGGWTFRKEKTRAVRLHRATAYSSSCRIPLHRHLPFHLVTALFTPLPQCLPVVQ